MNIVRAVFTLGLGSLAFLSLACANDDGRKPTFPVAGKVLLNGKAAEHASVVFHPIDDATSGAVKPRGKVGADGSFTLTTYDGNDGAPAGDYRVTVELWLAGRTAEEPPSNRLPVALSKPNTSGLKATVNARPTELAAFTIKK